MARNLVLNDGVLSVKTEVVSYEPVELDQLKGEVEVKEAAVNELTTQLEAVNAQLTEAQAALSDCKSEFELGVALVGVPTDEAGTDGTDGEVADTDTQPEPEVQY